MADCPDPLTPADCDLRDFKYMPLDVVRLRDSELTSQSGDVFRDAVLSWCAAWHQVPAASLPDDDALLARLLGYGRDLKSWQKVRNAGALRGYIECSDGRLYHPVVAEKANEAWQRKQAQRDRTAAARSARLSQRLSQDSVTDNATSSKGEERRGEEQRGEEQAAAAREKANVGGRHPANGAGPPKWEDAAIEPEPTDHRPCVNGFYLDFTFEEALEAANIDPVRSKATWKPVIAWLKDGIEPSTILAAIRRCAERADYDPPRSLAYFDRPVREEKPH